MPIVEIDILGTPHRVACGEGEEDKLRVIAAGLDEKLRDIASSSPSSTDLKILVLNSLKMEYELLELKRSGGHNDSAQRSRSNQDQEDVLAKTLEAVTDYVETLANKIEKL